MALRIKTNLAAVRAERSLDITTNKLEDNMQKLSSGYRINSASDDAAGLAISENMRGTIRSMSVARRNAMDGMSVIQVAEGSMQEITNILIRMRELSVQSATDTIGNRERSFLNKEYNQLVEEIDRIQKTTEFNGMRLFEETPGREMDSFSIFVGVGANIAPGRDTIMLDVENLRKVSIKGLGLEIGENVGPVKLDGTFERTIAAEKMNVVDTAINRLNAMRADLGASQRRLNSTISVLRIAEENLYGTKSRIMDTDYAHETAQFVQNKILQQAGAGILKQANSSADLVLTLMEN